MAGAEHLLNDVADRLAGDVGFERRHELLLAQAPDLQNLPTKNGPYTAYACVILRHYLLDPMLPYTLVLGYWVITLGTFEVQVPSTTSWDKHSNTARTACERQWLQD